MKAAIYARYSSDNQREESIEAQTRAITEYCRVNAIEVVKVYTDEALSGTSDKRPAFQEMIADSKMKRFDVVIVHKLDRFARDRYDSAVYKKALRDNGVKLISVLERLDDSPESIILESMLEGMAEYYSMNLAREVKKGLKENALKAKHNGGPTPFGYNLDKDKNLIINEYEALAVKKIFDLYLVGYGYTNIAHSLNEQGISTRLGRKFSKISIRDILMNEKYTGTYVYGRRADGKTLDKINPDEKIIRIPDAHPRIISPDVFKVIQEKMKSETKGAGPRMRKEVYLLTGKLFCGECGSAYTGIGYMTGKNRENKYYQYGCVGRKKNKSCSNKSIRKDQIEEYVLQKLKDEVFTDQNIEALVDKLMDVVENYNEGYETELKAVKSKITQLESKANKVWDVFFEDQMDKVTLNKKISEINEDIKFYKEKLILMETKNFTGTDREKLRNYLLASKFKVESGDPVQQRKVIESFVGKIFIYNDRIEATFTVYTDENNCVSDKSSGANPLLTISLTTQREFIKFFNPRSY